METHRSNDEDTINVIFASDDNYVRYLGTAIISLCLNKLPATKIRITVLDDSISEENKLKLCQCVKGENVQLVFLNIAELHLERFPVSARYTNWVKTTYARLFIPFLINCKKCIYLDCDIVILSDIKKLFDIDLGYFPIGAVRVGLGGGEENIENFYRSYGVVLKNYFNAGILLINADLWRKQKIGERSVEFIEKYKPSQLDQDALNYSCANNWKILSEDFNDTFNKKNKNAIIIHYVAKPLNYYSYVTPYNRKLFFLYFDRTPWGDKKLIYSDKNFKNRIKKPIMILLRIIGFWHYYEKIKEMIDPYKGAKA